MHTHTTMSNRWGLVSSYLANVSWLLIYLISFNRSVIEIHQKFLSVHSPLMSVGFQHLLRLHYRGSSLGPLIPQSDRALVTEIINLKTLPLMLLKNSWCLIVEEVLHEVNTAAFPQAVVCSSGTFLFTVQYYHDAHSYFPIKLISYIVQTLFNYNDHCSLLLFNVNTIKARHIMNRCSLLHTSHQ